MDTPTLTDDEEQQIIEIADNQMLLQLVTRHGDRHDLEHLQRLQRQAARTTLETLQATLPWGAHNYSAAFVARTDPQRDAAHALLHIHKAAGRLDDVIDGFDHADNVVGTATARRREAEDKLADLIICAARFANTYPGRGIGLAAAGARRLEEKFPARDPHTDGADGHGR